MVICVIALFPFYWVVITSLKNKKDIFTEIPKVFFRPTFSNYSNIINNEEFINSLINSVIISFSVTILVIVLGILAAYAFSRYNIRGKNNYFFFVLTTRMGPPVAFVLPLYLIMSKMRLIDTYPALIFTYLLMNLAFCIWMMKGFIDAIPIEIDESAKLDGCSTLKIILKVIIHLSRSGLFAVGIFSFILTWNEFFYALNLTRSEARTFPVLLPAYMGVLFPKWEQICAASVILSIPVIILALVISKHLVKALTLGAVKG
jgi:multiple sugar transport system permease protein